jgi:hypothetical protein
MTTYNAVTRHCYGTAASWTSNNPTLLAGEIGVESDTRKAKVGDGSTAWNALAYMVDFVSLADPNADRLVFWDDSAGNYAFLTPGSGLSITTTTITAGVGKHTIWVPATAMTTRTTNGAAAGSTELATNKIMVATLDFDTATAEFAQFSIAMPKSWNEGTVTFVPYWSHAATTVNFGVTWKLAGVAVSNDDALDAAFGTAVASTDTGGTTNDVYVGPESAAVTIAGTPAEGDIVVFQVSRDPADGGDTMAIDARLHGIKLIYTTDAGTDD